MRVVVTFGLRVWVRVRVRVEVKSGVWGWSVDRGGRRIMKKKKIRMFVRGVPVFIQRRLLL